MILVVYNLVFHRSDYLDLTMIVNGGDLGEGVSSSGHVVNSLSGFDVRVTSPKF